jgi:CubicO group peptidase (beta-lactamase class C family)
MSHHSGSLCIALASVTLMGIVRAQTHESSPHAAGADLHAVAIEQRIRALVTKGDLPSLQAAIVSDGRIVWSKAFGQDSSLRTVYMNGSIQKVFDATAILQLHEQGLLDIDKDVNSYLPFPFRHPGYPEIPITIKMLLAQRSGLDAFKDQFYWDTEGKFEPDSTQRKRYLDTLTLEGFLRASLDPAGTNYSAEAWRFEPGTQYHYSVSAYSILKYILIRVTGETYPQYMREHILEPLSMGQSVFTAEDSSMTYARPFTRKDGRNLPLPLWEGNVSLMRSTAADMAKFLLVHMNGGSSGDIRILKPETIALMHARHSHKKGLFHLTGNCPFPGYGLGIIDYGSDWYGHGGSTVGFQSLWAFNKSNLSGYVILTNVNGILHGQKDFDDVWATVSAVEQVLKSAVEPPPILKYILLCLCLFAAGGGLIFFMRWRRAQAQ